MDNLFELLKSTLCDTPSWILPQTEELCLQNVQSLTLSELSVVDYLCAECVHTKMDSYVAKVLELCSLPPLLATETVYHISLCSQFHSCLGPVIYHSVIKPIPIDSVVEH